MNIIKTLDLFPELSSALINLLKEIKLHDWNKPSPIRGRNVKDLVSHLTDGSLRRLSLQRDKHTSNRMTGKVQPYTDLVNYIQKLNREWMEATDRLSPHILLDLFRYAEKELFVFFKTLDPQGKAIFPVQWAGEEESQNWFDIAREFTEKWHHQMQIRMALKKPLLMDTKFTEPLYDTFMCGLPHFYRDMTDYPDGESIKISVTGHLNKSWLLLKQGKNWTLNDKTDQVTRTNIEISENDAWKIFTNTDREKNKYRSEIKINGDKKLGYKILEFVTVLS